MGLVVTVTPNAALDHTLDLDERRPGRRHRVRSEHAQAGGKGVNVARVLAGLGFAVRSAVILDGERGHASAAPLPAKLRRALFAVSLCSTLLAPLCAIPAHAAESDAHASTASTSRWWKLECGDASRKRAAEPMACTFTVKLRGGIDGSRLRLVQQALQRRDAARRALRREVELHVDVDSQGGEIFAALEIGRMLRAERASISVGRGAACISSCVFLLMGAVARSISTDARLGIHRPSLGASGRGGPKQASEDAIVDAMSEELVLYAQQMNVPRKIVDDSMLVPPDRVELLSPSELAGYGIHALDPVALEERRARSQSLLHPGAARER